MRFLGRNIKCLQVVGELYTCTQKTNPKSNKTKNLKNLKKTRNLETFL